MGRKRIQIAPIANNTIRKSTFEKRRVGLLKKAMELSILCGVPISVTMEEPDEQHSLSIYSSHPFEEIVLDKFESVSNYRLFTNDHFNDMKPGRYSKQNIGYRISKTPSMRSSSISNTSISRSTEIMENDQDPPFMYPPMIFDSNEKMEQENNFHQQHETKPFVIDTNWQKHHTSEFYGHEHKHEHNSEQRNNGLCQIKSNFADVKDHQCNPDDTFQQDCISSLMSPPPLQIDENMFSWANTPIFKALPVFGDDDQKDNNDSINMKQTGKRRSVDFTNNDQKMIQRSPRKRRRLSEPIFQPQIYNFQ